MRILPKSWGSRHCSKRHAISRASGRTRCCILFAANSAIPRSRSLYLRLVELEGSRQPNNFGLLNIARRDSRWRILPSRPISPIHTLKHDITTSASWNQTQTAELSQNEDPERLDESRLSPSPGATPARNASDRVLPRLNPSIDGDRLAAMIKVIRIARSLGLPDDLQYSLPEPAWTSVRRPGHGLKSHLGRKSHMMVDQLRRISKRSQYQVRKQDRMKLPMMAEDVRQELLRLLEHSQVLVIAGSTGCGKTTQVPQIILDSAVQEETGASCSIVCTQPRRISATSIARRVAYERCEPIGKSVGYNVRFDTAWPSQPVSILYCTTGALLKRLQDEPDRLMSESTHLIIDEAHERTVATDRLVTLLRDLIHRRISQNQPYPKLIVMSATLNPKVFLDYFRQPRDSNRHQGLETSFMEVKGRMFAVDKHYLGDIFPALRALAATDKSFASLIDGSGKVDPDTKVYIDKELDFAKKNLKPCDQLQDDKMDESEAGEANEVYENEAEHISPNGLLAATIALVAKTSDTGDILAFAPGIAEIDRTSELLSNRKPLGFEFGGDQLPIFKLHSSLSDTNDDVFKPIPEGCRRIVIATNIAESSITLPNVEHVIDMGKARSLIHDHLSGDHEYTAHWISKAISKQRYGRAGRVRPGHYYALFTHERYESFEEHAVPEIARIDLVGTCLDVIASEGSADVPEFLGRCPTPPDPQKVTAALRSLEGMRAVTDDMRLTVLGRVMALIPLEPAAAKTVLLGILFKCLHPMLIIACSQDERPLVHHSTERTGKAESLRSFASESESDMIGFLNAFLAYEKAKIRGDHDTMESLTQDRFVRPNVYLEIERVAQEVYEYLADAGLLPKSADPRVSISQRIPDALNINSNNIPLLKALLLTTLTPNLGISISPKGPQYWIRGGQRAIVAPTTVNRMAPKSFLRFSGRIRQQGDMIAHSARRETQDAKHPWMDRTSMITPLTAVLFVGAAEQHDTLIKLHEVVDVEFDVENNYLGITNKNATKLLLETRKAIDRFCTLAFEDLKYTGLQSRSWKRYGDEGGLRRSQARRGNFMLNVELRDEFVSGIAALLAAEDEALMRKFRLQRGKWLEEEAREAAAKGAAAEVTVTKEIAPTSTTAEEAEARTSNPVQMAKRAHLMKKIERRKQKAQLRKGAQAELAAFGSKNVGHENANLDGISNEITGADDHEDNDAPARANEQGRQTLTREDSTTPDGRHFTPLADEISHTPAAAATS